MAPVEHRRCLPVKPAETPSPAVRREPHPDYPGSVATYITAEGRALPLWTEADVAYSYEVIELHRRGQVAA